MPPKMRQSAEEVNKAYNIKASEKDCTGLIHYIDTSGGCQCGFFIDGEPGGSFPFVPNRLTRRRLQSHKHGEYVKTEADIQRMKEQREREESRRAIRERARLSRREASADQPPRPVSLLVGAEAREAEDD